MSKEIEAQVKMKLDVLVNLATSVDDDTFYKGVVTIAHDYILAGCRREMIDFLCRVPVEYFQGEAFRLHCQDQEFFNKVEEMALVVINFNPKGDQSVQN